MRDPSKLADSVAKRWAPGDDEFRDKLITMFYDFDKEWYDEHNNWLRAQGKKMITFQEWCSRPPIYWMEQQWLADGTIKRKFIR